MAPARKFSRTPPPNKPPSLPVKPQSSILTAPSPEVLAKLPARLDYDALKRSFAAATKACREVARELPGVVEGCAAHGDAASWARELGPATGPARATARRQRRDLLAAPARGHGARIGNDLLAGARRRLGLEEASRSGEEGEVARRLLSDWFAPRRRGDGGALPPGYGGETLRDLAQASEKLAELQRVAAGVAPSPARPRNAAAASAIRAPRGSSLVGEKLLFAAALRDDDDACHDAGASQSRRRPSFRWRKRDEGSMRRAAEALVALDGSGAALRDVWVGALAGRVAARCAARERARKDRGDAETGADRLRTRCGRGATASSSPHAAAARHTDDANRSDTDDDDREAAPWSCDVRAMPRGAAELRCRVDDLLDSISTACDRREAEWLGGSLRAAAVRAGVVDDACHDLGVERLRDYDALLAGPLRGAVVAEASEKLRASPTARDPPRDAAARAGAETAGAADAAFKADLESTLADAAKQFAKALGAAFADARGEKDFAIKDEPDELRPTRATLLFRDELSGRADGVARALGGGDELLHRWRAALADEVFAVEVWWSGGAGRAELPVLQPDGPLAGLDRARSSTCSRRTDAWTYGGRRAAWVDEAAASF
ncbi:hypothetical protein JL720_14803 [Aureococcus anophagefferens]|nr:hypothetical protein JL720_14803 [Aureococcus anophagefferens]